MLYLDESGDLGFSFEKGSSKFFVIGYIQTSLSEEELSKLIKIAKQRTIKKKEDRKIELKGSQCNYRTKEFLLNLILKADKNLKINSFVLNKINISKNKRDKKRAIYNQLCENILNCCYES